MRAAARVVCIAAGMAAAWPAGSACAQLRPSDVLVIYDSRIADSLAVAEYYAGSAAVPGGAGGFPGVRAGVRVLNLASTGAPVTAPGDMSYPDFTARLRDPIRAHLTANALTQRVRCLVLTKGLPHRVRDTDNLNVGDNPGLFIDEINQQDVTCASVDSELTLLWFNLTTGEAGGLADSRADGMVLNPYWKSALPIGQFTTANILAAKTFTSSFGPVWQSSGTGAARLTAGDIYLVCRLDGHTVAGVRGMIDRAQGVMYNVNTNALLLDESNSNGVPDPSGNSEFDNSGSLTPLLSGDDYERTRDLLNTTDRRFLSSNVRYDPFANAANFFVGPRIDFQGQGALVSAPVALLATYGSNHAGTFPLTSGGVSAAITFADSFNYVNGAVFNTIESYNGRDFGGIGQAPGIPQEQLADFLAAGGTFGIGHVWEPLADTIPDNEFLSSNFLLGQLSWAEAAWSSVPCLSWMHVVVGDPLARASRTSEDVNADGRVTIADLYAWEAAPTDINRDGSSNSTDRAFVIRALRFYERFDLANARP